MDSRRRALVIATYEYADGGLRRLAAAQDDAEALADVLQGEAIAGFDITVLGKQPHTVRGEAVADFYGGAGREDLTLLYFTGHGVKDDEGRLYLAMTNTRREALMFTAISAAQLNDAMDASTSRRKVLILDCCYSGAFPASRTAKSDEGVQTLERFQGKGRAVLTASDATQYAFEGDDLRGSGTSSVFTRYLVEAIRSGEADLDEDGDIALDELYSYVREKVVAEVPQQRPKKQEDVDGRIVIARNVHWTLPAHLQHALESPIAAQRLSAVEGLAHLHRVGNDVVRAIVAGHVAALADDDSRSVSSAATALLERINPPSAPAAVPASRTAAPVTVERPVVPVPVPAAAAGRSSPAAVRPATPPTEPARAEAPVGGRGPAAAGPPEPPPGARPAGPAAEAAGAPATGEPSLRARVPLALGLVLISALPLTLARVLHFESSYPNTFDQLAESTVPWTLAVVLPLVAAAVLLGLGERRPGALPWGVGLVLGTALVLTETSIYWADRFVDERDSLAPGPALGFLLLGWAAVVGAAVAGVTRSGLGVRAAARADRGIVCALVVVVCLVVAMAGVSAAGNPWVWLRNNAGLLLLGLAALPQCLLRLRRDQAVAG